MESQAYNYTLSDLLCLSKFKTILEPTGTDDTLKAIVEWAEREVMSGNDAESLLILASLNLDKSPDAYEVRLYLDRYMIETGLNYPNDEVSALTWLKIKLWNITHCEDARTAESYLSYFTIYFLDYAPRFFARTCSYLRLLHYQLYDDYGDSELYPYLASKMSNEEILNYIKKQVRPFEQKLFAHDWLAVLAKE